MCVTARLTTTTARALSLALALALSRYAILLERAKHPATVCAKKFSDCFTLSKDDFDAVGKLFSEMYERVVEIGKQRFRELLFFATTEDPDALVGGAAGEGMKLRLVRSCGKDKMAGAAPPTVQRHQRKSGGDTPEPRRRSSFRFSASSDEDIGSEVGGGAGLFGRLRKGSKDKHYEEQAASAANQKQAASAANQTKVVPVGGPVDGHDSPAVPQPSDRPGGGGDESGGGCGDGSAPRDVGGGVCINGEEIDELLGSSCDRTSVTALLITSRMKRWKTRAVMQGRIRQLDEAFRERNYREPAAAGVPLSSIPASPRMTDSATTRVGVTAHGATMPRCDDGGAGTSSSAACPVAAQPVTVADAVVADELRAIRGAMSDVHRLVSLLVARQDSTDARVAAVEAAVQARNARGGGGADGEAAARSERHGQLPPLDLASDARHDGAQCDV